MFVCSRVHFGKTVIAVVAKLSDETGNGFEIIPLYSPRGSTVHAVAHGERFAMPGIINLLVLIAVKGDEWLIHENRTATSVTYPFKTYVIKILNI